VGTAINLLDPVGGRCKVSVRTTKMAPDLAQAVLIWGKLNTHTPTSLYKAFPPAEAWQLRLGIAEVELSLFHQAMPEPAHFGSGNTPSSGNCLGAAAQCRTDWRFSDLR